MDFKQKIRSLLSRGRKVEAVKLYKEQTGYGLKDAKDAVETLQDRANVPNPNQVDAKLESELLDLLQRGEKLKAVKLYRDQLGATLMESKLAVESIGARHGVMVEQTGCSGFLVVIMTALIGIAVLAGLVMLKQ